MKKSKETNAFLSGPVKSMNVDIGLQLDDLLWEPTPVVVVPLAATFGSVCAHWGVWGCQSPLLSQVYSLSIDEFIELYPLSQSNWQKFTLLMTLQMELGTIGHLATVEKYIMRTDCFCWAEICRNVWESNHPKLSLWPSYLSEEIQSSHPMGPNLNILCFQSFFSLWQHLCFSLFILKCYSTCTFSAHTGESFWKIEGSKKSHSCSEKCHQLVNGHGLNLIF